MIIKRFKKIHIFYIIILTPFQKVLTSNDHYNTNITIKKYNHEEITSYFENLENYFEEIDDIIKFKFEKVDETLEDLRDLQNDLLRARLHHSISFKNEINIKRFKNEIQETLYQEYKNLHGNDKVKKNSKEKN